MLLLISTLQQHYTSLMGNLKRTTTASQGNYHFDADLLFFFSKGTNHAVLFYLSP